MPTPLGDDYFPAGKVSESREKRSEGLGILSNLIDVEK